MGEPTKPNSRRGFLGAVLSAPALAVVPAVAAKPARPRKFPLRVEVPTQGGEFLGVFLPPLITDSMVIVDQDVPLDKQFKGDMLVAVQTALSKL